MRILILCTILALTLLSAAGNADSADYTVINLGSLGGSTSYTYAYDINNSGQVTGYSQQPASNSYGGNIYSYIWNPETRTMTTPGSIGGGSLAYNGWNRGYGINENGTITGYYYHYGGEMPFTYSAAAGIQQVPIRGSGYYWYAGRAYDINDAGAVLGVVSKQQGYPYTDAFLYDADGSFTTLGFGNVTEVGGINNSGEAVGSTWGSNSGMNAWVYKNGQVSWLGALGDDPSLLSGANDINDIGLVTGGAQLWYDATPSNPYDLDYKKVYHAFIWDEENGMTDLGSLIGAAGSSSGTAINSLGQVVGMSSTSTWGGSQHAFLWEEGLMHDLNSFLPENSGWLLEEAYAINDRGEIVGVGTYNGVRAAYLLTPVPEPSTFALMAAGLAGAVLLRRRARK